MTDAMSDYSTILLDVKDGIATLTLNRPEKLNAATATMFDEIRDALASLDRKQTRALLLRGAGRGFCSGADHTAAAIAVADGGYLDPASHLEASIHPTMSALATLELPVVAAVQGPCTGVGVALALSADFVIAARSAFFMISFVKVGLIPDAGIGWTLPRMIGRARAAQMMMLGERVPAGRALEWGLIYDVIEDDRLASEAVGLATRLAEGPTRALGLIHRGVLEASEQSFEEAMTAEIERQRMAARSADAREGIAALIARRPPQFRGY